MKNDAPVGEYWESWNTFRCPGPECQKINWICEGDVRDYSGNDTEAAICWNCGIKFWINDEIKRDPSLYGYEDDEDALNPDDRDLIERVYDRKGREKP